MIDFNISFCLPKGTMMKWYTGKIIILIYRRGVSMFF